MTYLLENNAERAKEDAIEREIRREKMRLYGDPNYDDSELEKPKRRAKERTMRLTDDGELTDDEVAAEATAVSKQKGR
jgi:acetyl-CoA carboxylase carboxyltransferase component